MPHAEHRRLAGRLFSYDFRIVSNALKLTFARWSDRIIAGIALGIGVAALRSGFLDFDWRGAFWPTLAMGALVGVAFGHAINAKLAFHSAEGPLAADALIERSRRGYAAAWHLTAGMVLLVILFAVLESRLLASALAGYAFGGLATHVMQPRAFSRISRDWWAGSRIKAVKSWLRLPRAGLFSAVLLILSLAPLSRWLAETAFLSVAGIEAAALVLALTSVDDGIVRFMTMTGFGPWQAVSRHMRGVAVFLAIAIPVCAAVFGLAMGAVVGAIGAAGLLFLALRVLAYRLHRKPLADSLLSVLAGVLALVTIAMPFILPAALALILWQMQRRARALTWTIA